MNSLSNRLDTELWFIIPQFTEKSTKQMQLNLHSFEVLRLVIVW